MKEGILNRKRWCAVRTRNTRCLDRAGDPHDSLCARKGYARRKRVAKYLQQAVNQAKPWND